MTGWNMRNVSRVRWDVVIICVGIFSKTVFFTLTSSTWLNSEQTYVVDQTLTPFSVIGCHPNLPDFISLSLTGRDSTSQSIFRITQEKATCIHKFSSIYTFTSMKFITYTLGYVLSFLYCVSRLIGNIVSVIYIKK